MMTRTRTLLIAAGVLVAYVGASWLIGIDVQSQLERREEQVLKDAPYLVLIHREYHRGIFGASEQATYGLRGPFGGLARLMPTASGGATLQFTVRDTIRHGPLPGLRTVALATVETTVIAPSELAERLSTAGGRPIIEVRTRLGWTGRASAKISSPELHMRLQNGAELSSSGFSASIESTHGQASWRGHGDSAGFSIQGPNGRAAAGGISFDADMKRAAEPINVGDFHVKVAGMQVQRASGAPMRMNGLTVTGTSAVHGDYIDSGIDVSADSVKAADLALTRVEYAFRFDHLQTASLASLTAALRAAQASAPPGSPAAAAAIRDALARYGVDLLVHDPVIEITRVGFTIPAGELRLRARVAAPGIRREDLTGAALVPALLGHLDATAELRVDAALLEKLVSGSPRGPAISAQLQALQQRGYLGRDGTAWVARLAYHGGKLTINGLAYPPGPPPPAPSR